MVKNKEHLLEKEPNKPPNVTMNEVKNLEEELILLENGSLVCLAKE